MFEICSDLSKPGLKWQPLLYLRLTVLGHFIIYDFFVNVKKTVKLNSKNWKTKKKLVQNRLLHQIILFLLSLRSLCLKKPV